MRRSSPEEELGAKLDELFSVGPRGAVRVLDVACGDGYASLVLAQRLAAHWPRARLVSVDRDPVVLGTAHSRAKRVDVGPCWLCADLHALPHAAATFDYIVALNIFHGTDRGRFAERMHLVLKSDGLLLTYDRSPELLTVPRLAITFDRERLAALRRLASRTATTRAAAPPSD